MLLFKLAALISPPKTINPKMEKVRKMMKARMKKWTRESVAVLRERVMTPRYGWKSMSLRVRTMRKNRLHGRTWQV